jgi:hypothetical protein
MHKPSRIAVIVAFLSLVLLPAAPLKAFCYEEVDHNFYDANGCWQGELYQGCSYSPNVGCHFSGTGTNDGAHWRHSEFWDCDTGAKTGDIWYVWNGSSWVVTSDPGLTPC